MLRYGAIECGYLPEQNIQALWPTLGKEQTADDDGPHRAAGRQLSGATATEKQCQKTLATAATHTDGGPAPHPATHTSVLTVDILAGAYGLVVP